MMDLHLAVRIVHTLGMGVMLGGALLLALQRDARPFAAPYEWTFWIAMGAQVATGVGNVGAVGDPGPDGAWGAIFSWKLGLVLVLLVVSVFRLLARADPVRLRGALGATALLVAAIGALAVVLAHG